MSNVMVALPNIGGALCSTPQSLADAHYEMPCSNAAKTRNQLKFAGCPKAPKLVKRSQPSVGRSSPYREDMWRRYCCLTSFFPIVDTWLRSEDIARQICGMVLRWRFLATFLRPVFSASRMQHVSDLHPKFALRPHHVWKYGEDPICDGWDEARKKERKKKEVGRRRNHRAKI